MIKKQNIVGKQAEFNVASLFKKNKYWALNIPKTVAGQPFDIIACKEDIAWLVDVKHLEANKASFAFERIEPNQRTSMSYAKVLAKMKNLGFVIEWERDVSRHFFLSYDKLIEMEENGLKSVRIEELEVFDDLLWK